MEKLKEDDPASTAERLVICCGRTEDEVKATLRMAQENPKDSDASLQETALSPIATHPYRGYTVVNSSSSDIHLTKVSSSAPGSVWFIFPGFGTQWHSMGRDLMKLDVFRQSIQECHDALDVVGLNLLNLLMEGDEHTLKDVTNVCVCLIAIKVALADILKAIGVTPDGMIGASLGELVCGYVDGCLTKSQTLLAAYWRGQSVKTAGVVDGTMAAVGITWEEANARCPEGIVAACYNTEGSVTFSGKADAMTAFLETLRKEGKFVKELETNRVPFHSPHLLEAAAEYRSALEKVIKTPRARSAKWISSSVKETEWDSEMARLCSAEYHAYNFLNPVRFHETVQHIPHGAVVIEIAPHSVLQNILKWFTSLDSCSAVVNLMWKDRDALGFLLSGCGRLYTAGISINPMKLNSSLLATNDECESIQGQ